MTQQFIDIKCTNLLTSIDQRRSSVGQNEISRSSKFHLVYQFSEGPGINLDRYCARQNMWKIVRRFDFKTKDSAMICHDGKLIIIGGRDAEGAAINTVNK